MQEPVARADLRFTEQMLARPKTGFLDVDSGLQHFAIVTYAIPAERLRPLVHRRFDLETIDGPNGSPQALISMVPFLDKDFHSAWLKYPQLTFGQTNYRAYVTDRYTGERVAWFFGTTLDSWSVAIPNRLWKLPWYRAHSTFDCEYDQSAGPLLALSALNGERLGSGEPRTRRHWRLSDRTARLRFARSGPRHPHPPIPRRVLSSRPPTRQLQRLACSLGTHGRQGEEREDRAVRRPGTLNAEEALQPHSVLIQPLTQFTIYLPPKKLGRPKPSGD